MSQTVTRRSALVAAVAAAAGGVAGFIFARNNDAYKSTANVGGYSPGGSDDPYGSGGGGKLITPLDKVPDGSAVITGGLVLTRSGQTVKAFSSTCTHQGCAVNRVSDGKVFCPCHGSVFNAATGAVVQGPAGSPLPTVNVTVKDGGIYSA
jgi:Rieske Fe-S protein